MVNGGLPVSPGQRLSLSVRDGYKRLGSKAVEYRNQVRKVEASVQRSDMWNRQIATHRKMKVSSVKMNQIELINVLNNVIYQKDFPRHGIFAAFILPERPLARCDKPRICNRIAAGKQSHVVSDANQFLSKVRDDPFRPSVMFRRNALDEWRNLSNSHIPFVPRRFRLRRRTTNSRPTSRGRNGAASPHEFKCCRSQFARDRCFGFVYPLQSDEFLNAREQYNLRNRFTSAALGAREIV